MNRMTKAGLYATGCAVLIFALAGCGSDGGTTVNGGGSNGGVAPTGAPSGIGSAGFPIPRAGPASNQGFDTFGNNGTFLSILPPGASPVAASPHFSDQRNQYDALTHAPENLTTAQLTPTYYHDEAFQPESAFSNSLNTVSDASHSVRYASDSSTGTPHVYGDTRADVFFGIGYVNGLDRLFLMDTLRHMGRGRMSDFLGPSPSNLASDRSFGLFAGYSEEEMHQQIENVAARFGTTGAQLVDDANNFVDGINEYIAEARDSTNTNVQAPPEYGALGLPLRDFTTRDVLAVAILINSRFAVGGGGEADDARLLNGIGQTFGKNANACKLWHDILESSDPERPNTITTRFETQSPPTFDTEACPFDSGFAATYPGAVLFDTGSFQPRTLLTTMACSAPNSGASGAPPCPNFGGDPVTDRFSGNGNSSGGTTSASSAGTTAGVTRFGPLLASLKRAPGTTRLPVPAAQTPAHDWLRLAQVARQARTREGRRLARQTVKTLVAYLNASQKGALQNPTAMSNATLVSRDNTANGHPLTVFGPQTGYFVPELELEFDAHGGGIDTRGMNFAGLPFVLIGRGKDYAWSATSAGADITDIRALKLCEPGNAGATPTPSSQGYIYNGQCKPFFTRTDQWTAETPPGTPNQAVTRSILRAPDYGPVMGFAAVNGTPIALAIQRATFFHALESALPFGFLDGNVVHDPESFMQAFNLQVGTFNWFYIDDNNIAYFMSGLLPKRADGIYPELPQWGDGRFDWAQTQTGSVDQSFKLTNFLPLTNHPREANPSRGYLTSWNNAQAPGFYAADDQYGFGPVHRVDMIDKRLTAALDDGEKLTPGDLVTLMIDFGSTDLRGQEILPLALDVLQQPGANPPLTADEQTAIGILSNWVDDGANNLGAMRRDRDNDGQYDDRQAVVLMDAWYNRMIDRALPQLVDLENTPQGNVVPVGRDDHPGPTGSAYISGYYGYLQRVLAMSLGQSPHPYRAIKCADTGTIDDCRQALITSLDNAIAALGGIDNRNNWDGTQDSNGEQGKKDSAGSTTVEARDMIRFQTIGLSPVDPILWQNRTTFQQVVSPTQSRTAR